MPVLSLWASNYPSPYSNDAEEIAANQYSRTHITRDPSNFQQSWWPNSPDFQAEARRQGGAGPVGSAQQLIRSISRSRNLSSVKVYCHGARSEIQFGNGNIIASANISSLSDVSRYFTPDGSITFIACNTGQDAALVQSMANALRVRVCCFTTGVRWRLEFNEQRDHITYRGRDERQDISPVCYSPQ